MKKKKIFRILQKVLGKLQSNDVQIFIHEIEKDFASLMFDSYGNYMCQALINVCTVEQRIYILQIV